MFHDADIGAFIFVGVLAFGTLVMLIVENAKESAARKRRRSIHKLYQLPYIKYDKNLYNRRGK